MSAILATSDETEQLFFLLKHAIDLLLFPRITQADKTAIIQHITWLEQQSYPVVDCRFETFPDTKETKIVIIIKPGDANARTN